MARILKELELHDLYDLLAGYTAKYTQLMRWGGQTFNLKECEDSILELQNEIDLRKAQTELPAQQDNNLDDGLELVPAPA